MTLKDCVLWVCRWRSWCCWGWQIMHGGVAPRTHWPCQAKGAISSHQVRSTVCQPMTHMRTERWVWWWGLWHEEINTQPINLLDVCTFGSILYPGPCFVAKNSITQSAFSCPLISFQSTRGSSKYPLVLFPLSHDLVPAHVHSSCDCQVLSCSCIPFHSVHKTGGYLSLTVSSNTDASGAKPHLVRGNIEN